MQKIVAIHDGSPQGWETIYLAFHVAARLGTPLLVLTLPGDHKQQSPSEQFEKIRTGGYAAGLAVEAYAIDRISADAILKHGKDLYTLLLPKDLAMERAQAPALAQALSCPVWVVTGKYEIRRLGALGAGFSEDFASQYAKALAERLGQPLIILNNGPRTGSPEEARYEGITWESLREVSVKAMKEQVNLKHIDVMIFSSRDSSFFQDCTRALSCILVLCPHERSKPLN